MSGSERGVCAVIINNAVKFTVILEPEEDGGYSVICPAMGPLVERLGQLGVATAVVPMEERLVDPRALLALVRHFRRERPHVVQSHGARTNFYGRLAARLAGVPRHLSTVHNSLYDYPVPALRRALRR